MRFIASLLLAPVFVCLWTKSSGLLAPLSLVDTCYEVSRLGAHADADGSPYQVSSPKGPVNTHSYTGEYIVIDTLLDDPRKISRDLLCAQTRLAGFKAVGLDFEFGGAPDDESDKFIALVQIAVPDFVMLLRTLRPIKDAAGAANYPKDELLNQEGIRWESGLPVWVRELLVNPSVKKAAVGFVGEDMKYLGLFKIHMTESTAASFGIVDLQKAIQQLVHVKQPPGFTSLANHFGLYPFKDEYKALHKAVEKKASLSEEDWFKWDAEKRIPETLIRYAAEDAWFALVIYKYLFPATEPSSVGSFMENMHPPSPSAPVRITGQSPDNREKQALQSDARFNEKTAKTCETIIGLYKPFHTKGYIMDVTKCTVKLCTSKCADFEIPDDWARGLGDATARLANYETLKSLAKAALCDAPNDEDMFCSGLWDAASFIASVAPRTLKLKSTSFDDNFTRGGFLFCSANDESLCTIWNGRLVGLEKVAIANRQPRLKVFVDEKMMPIFQSIEEMLVNDENSGPGAKPKMAGKGNDRKPLGEKSAAFGK